MKYFDQKQRISTIINKDIFDSLIGNYINEVRDEVARKNPLRFLQGKKTISLATSLYLYPFDYNQQTSRYGGFFDSVYYDNNSGNDPVRLTYYEPEAFDYYYPIKDTADPTVYTVRGRNFEVNNLPSVLTSKTFITRYYALPDKLAYDSDEKEIDLRYSDYTIHRVCYRMYNEIIEMSDPTKSIYHERESDRAYSRMLLQESIFLRVDKQDKSFITRAN
jgi:hypothetical protein